ncbi:MAG: isoprenylcysteine carboxylmethyltransferase family protein [Chloroflexota bacterium]|nr:MAG: isoprenylcysteine carboxylmethyltransferase family protein [Chloroflexota bacterium]
MPYDYGLWPLVVLNVALFGIFAASFLRPMEKREWRSLGVLSAFVVALFTEMYGFPLTIYLIAALLGRLPAGQPFSHESGTLWAGLLLGPEWGAVFMLIGGLLMGGGLWLVASAWRLIHAAHGRFVTKGPYARIRHPQYSGLLLGIAGALVQWPTLITLVMAPVLVTMYWRLAKREDRELEMRFGEEYRAYRALVPGFLPARITWWIRRRSSSARHIVRGLLRQPNVPPVKS